MGKWLRKAKERLEKRQKHYDGMVQRDRYNGRGYTRPGSLKK